ncbi:MAG: hypothetical protein ACXVAX_01240 [Pseudobdellovibrio sp.]
MISFLDLLRSKILKLTLKMSVLQYLFYNRPGRVFVLFLLAVIFYLATSLFFPLWVLLIGPIVWGVPHLIASLRYSTHNLNLTRDRRVTVQKIHLVLWLSVFLYRFFVDIIEYPVFLSQHPLLFEGLALSAASALQIYLLKKSFSSEEFFKRELLKSFFSVLFSGFVVAMIYLYPIQTALTALIGHNYLPLFFWYKSCATKKDLRIFAASAFLFILASCAIYFGWLTGLYHRLAPQGHITFLNWDYSDIIKPYVTEEFDYEFWYRIVSLYAFSQALHYFMWLKAIPENFQKQAHPPSFRSSFSMLQNEFGAGAIGVLLIFCLIGISLWAIFEFQSARLFYFSLASYHGFMELSAVAFLKNKKLKKKE